MSFADSCEAYSPWLETSWREVGSVGRELVVGVGVEVVAGSGAGVPGAKSALFEARGTASSCSAELGSGGLPSDLGGSCSSQEVPLRALSTERRACAHTLVAPAAAQGPPKPTRLPALGPWGREGEPWAVVVSRQAPSPPG